MTKKENDTDEMITTANQCKPDFDNLDALDISGELRAELRKTGLFSVDHIMELTSDEIERYGSSLMCEQYLGLIAAVRIYLKENGKEGTFPKA